MWQITKPVIFILLLSIFISYSECKEKLRVGMITVSSHGHVSPLRPLIAELQSRSHEVYFFSFEEARKKVPTVDKYFSLSNKTMEMISDAVLEGRDFATLPEIPVLFGTVEAELLPRLVESFKELEASNQKPDVLIVDFLTTAGMDIGEHLNIPVIISYPGIFRPSFNAPTWTPHLFSPYSENEMASPIARLYNCLISVFEKYIGWQLMTVSTENRAKHGMPENTSLRKALYNNKIILVHSFPPLNPPSTALLGSEYYIGSPQYPLNALDPELLAWIEAADSPIVFVSMGTVTRQKKELLDQMIDAFTSLTNYRFIWSIRDSVKQRTDRFNIISQYPHIRLASWVDQNSLLRQEKLKVFFTHGGFNSVVESIQAAKPMVCMPFLVDQPRNCKRVASLSVGEMIKNEEFTPALFKQALEKALSHSERVKELSAYSNLFSENGMNTAANLIEVVAVHGDASLLPIEAEFPWYVRGDLDLFAIYTLFVVLTTFFSSYLCCFRRRKVTPQNKTIKKD